MKGLLLLFVLLVAHPAAAQVRVISGEHDGFTRVVLQGPGLAGWQVVRRTTGYEVRLRMPVRIDLSRAFDIIGRQRVRGLAPLATGNGLAMTIGCACHAIPFELEPGVIVIDVRDGPPPEGSSFELAADGQRLAPLVPVTFGPPRPRPRPVQAWNWVRDVMRPQPSYDPAPELPGPAAAALRAALLEQLGRGVAEGVVDPVRRLPTPPDGSQPPEGSSVWLGDLPGLSAHLQRDPSNLTSKGQTCLPDEQVALENWGQEGVPVHMQMADAMATLLGEFDRPDPEAVRKAIRLRLWLGFGAEAGLMLDSLGADLPEAAALRAMARIVDGLPAPDAAFRDMESCGGAAALWAVLATPETRLPATDIAAVQRAFSALPPHLRQHLGPALVRHFLDAGQEPVAQTLRMAMARTEPEGAVQLVDADLAMAGGDAAAAEAVVETLKADAGSDRRAMLFSLVEARAALNATVSPDELTAIEAFHTEAPDAASERAVILARALAGDFDTAFALAADARAVTPDLWPILSAKGPDSAVIAHAVAPPAEGLNAIPADIRRKLSERLLSLGFADSALGWVDGLPDAEFAARIELARGDAAAALRRLGGQRGETADRLRAEALLAQGNPAAAATILSDIDAAEAARARLRSRQWDDIAPEAPEGWQAVAARLQPVTAEGTLGQGRAVAEESAATRADIEALLQATAVLDAPPLTESQGSAP